MRVTFEPDINMAYIYLTRLGDAHKIQHTEALVIDLPGGSRQLVNLDFDSDGRLLGIEIDGASAALPRSLLAAAERPRGTTGKA